MKKKQQQNIVWDSYLKGFGIRSYSSGKRSYVLKVTRQSKSKFMTIGDVKEIALTEAREIALAKKKSLETELQSSSIKSLCIQWFNHVGSKQKSRNDSERRIQRWIIPKLGHLKADSISMLQYRELHKEISETAPVEANRVLKLMSAILNRGIRWELCTMNKAKFVELNRETSRSTLITIAVIKDIFDALDNRKNIYSKTAIKLLFYTGLRKNELLTLKWSDIDKEERTVLIRETKSGVEHRFYLSEQAFELLSELPISKCEYVFPNTTYDGHLKNINSLWKRICKEINADGIRIHDIRRTTSTMLANSGMTIAQLQKFLNHSSLQATSVYVRKSGIVNKNMYNVLATEINNSLA